MSNISDVIVSHQPNFNKSRNWTLDRMRHVHVLLSCISEFSIDFIEDVEPLASFCPKNLSRGRAILLITLTSVILGDTGAESISSQGGRAPDLKSTPSPWVSEDGFQSDYHYLL